MWSWPTRPIVVFIHGAGLSAASGNEHWQAVFLECQILCLNRIDPLGGLLGEILIHGRVGHAKQRKLS